MQEGRRPERPVGICVVGCGQIARQHLNAIAALEGEARLVSVVDADEERARQAAARYGAPHWSTDYAEAFARPEVEAAVLCLPHHLHAPVTIAAARAGLHVLCEKPMALNAQEAEAMVAAAEQRGVQLMIGHSRRFSPAAERARRLVAADALGRLRHISSILQMHVEQPSTAWRRSRRETGGFMIPIFGTHLIDLLLWVSGYAVRRVYCQASANRPDMEGEDETAIVLTLTRDGTEALPCTVIMSANCRFPRELGERSRDELIIAGERGTLVLSRDRLLVASDAAPQEEAASPQPGGGGNFIRQMKEFIDAVVTGREPLSSGREALAVMRVLDACHRSAQEHAPVDLWEGA